MNRDIFIRNLTKEKIEMSPKGRNANELTVVEFEKDYERFFDMIFEIAGTDISSETGYGEFDENNKAPYQSVEEFIRETFNEKREGYWKNWTEMFETSFLKKEYFDEIFSKAMEYSSYCEGQRYLVNNNTFFCNMLVDDTGKTYCADWGRAGIMDYMKDFKERFLCMAYFKGIDTLRWHASIDDRVSCESIVKSINALEERMSKY